jgi:hypothetical protein
MALKQYREAARTAIIIAREEQNAGKCFTLTSKQRFTRNYYQKKYFDPPPHF